MTLVRIGVETGRVRSLDRQDRRREYWAARRHTPDLYSRSKSRTNRALCQKGWDGRGSACRVAGYDFEMATGSSYYQTHRFLHRFPYLQGSTVSQDRLAGASGWRWLEKIADVAEAAAVDGAELATRYRVSGSHLAPIQLSAWPWLSVIESAKVEWAANEEIAVEQKQEPKAGFHAASKFGQARIVGFDCSGS